jgi:hypothetical protein
MLFFLQYKSIRECLGVQVAFWTGNHLLLSMVDVIDKKIGQRDEIISDFAIGGWWCCGWYGG